MSFEQQTEMDETTDVFYIDSIKFVTLTKTKARGVIDNEDSATVNEFFNLLLENGQQSCVVDFYNKIFSFWTADEKYFFFQPLNKSPKCVQFATFDCVRKYLQKFFVDVASQADYAFHSVDILKVNVFGGDDDVLQKFYQNVTGKGSTNSVDFAQESFGLGNVPHKMCFLPHNPMQTSYERLTEYADVLRCPKSIDRVGVRLKTIEFLLLVE